MSEEWMPFRMKCPSCDNKEEITWEHCKGFGEKINRKGEVKCENPNCCRFSKPEFIMELSFNCGQHHGEGIKPNMARVFIALSRTLLYNLSRDDRQILVKRIFDYLND